MQYTVIYTVYYIYIYIYIYTYCIRIYCIYWHIYCIRIYCVWYHNDIILLTRWFCDYVSLVCMLHPIEPIHNWYWKRNRCFSASMLWLWTIHAYHHAIGRGLEPNVFSISKLIYVVPGAMVCRWRLSYLIKNVTLDLSISISLSLSLYIYCTYHLLYLYSPTTLQSRWHHNSHMQHCQRKCNTIATGCRSRILGWEPIVHFSLIVKSLKDW